MVLYLGFVILFGLKLKSWDDEIPGHCYNAYRMSSTKALHPYVDTIYLALTSVWFFLSLGLSAQTAISSLAPLILDLYLLPVEAQDQPRNSKRNFSASYATIWNLSLDCLGIGLTVLGGYPFPWVIGKLRQKPRWEGSVAKIDNLLEWLSPALDQRFLVLVIALFQYPLHSYMLFTLRTSNVEYLSGDSENTWGFGQVVALVLLGSTALECFRAFIGQSNLWQYPY